VNTFFFFFPDPWPKRRHHRRRLFTGEFVTSLHRALRPQGRFHVATDHADYLETIRGLFSGDARFRPIPPFEPEEDEQTEFERIFRSQNVPIGRRSFERV
jgi:tRNA (guanine-N7-)-methyltransferase